ncbi:MAG: HAD family hydrolase [Candidatus Aenigmarchaeota archaeon]|nr:HAD family hydrolase [Candidatus Aenigmarchaeota archaeon]
MAKSVILDFDGVLVDSFASVYKIYKVIGKKLKVSIPPSKKALGDSFAGDYRELFMKIGIRTRKQAERAVDIFRKYSSKYPGMKRLFPGVRTLLKTLRRMGYRIGIVSNNYQDHIERTLKEIGIRKHIDVVVGVNGLKRMKPDPAQIFRCMKKLGSTPEETVYVGDMEVDVLAAKAAGVRMVAATYGVHSEERLSRFNPDFMVGSPREILNVVN